jgi:hypothetical protein
MCIKIDGSQDTQSERNIGAAAAVLIRFEMHNELLCRSAPEKMLPFDYEKFKSQERATSSFGWRYPEKKSLFISKDPQKSIS